MCDTCTHLWFAAGFRSGFDGISGSRWIMCKVFLSLFFEPRNNPLPFRPKWNVSCADTSCHVKRGWCAAYSSRPGSKWKRSEGFKPSSFSPRLTSKKGDFSSWKFLLRQHPTLEDQTRQCVVVVVGVGGGGRFFFVCIFVCRWCSRPIFFFVVADHHPICIESWEEWRQVSVCWRPKLRAFSPSPLRCLPSQTGQFRLPPFSTMWGGERPHFTQCCVRTRHCASARRAPPVHPAVRCLHPNNQP